MLNQNQTVKDNIEKYNKPNPLVDFLIPLIEDKKEVKIADIGSGPYSIIGSYLEGVKLEIRHSDKQDFANFWYKYSHTPFMYVEYQDMEKLTYLDNYFDIVCCLNALDHTKKAYKALLEMIRVCKPGGFVYIDCHLDQATTGHKHFWDAKKDGWFIGKDASFNLQSLGFKVQFIDNGGESRYDKIIAILQKP